MCAARKTEKTTKLWERLMLLLERKQMSINAFGHAIGKSGVAMGKWRDGKSKPVLATRQKMASVLGVPLDEIIRLDDDEPGLIGVAPKAKTPSRKMVLDSSAVYQLMLDGYLREHPEGPSTPEPVVQQLRQASNSPRFALDLMHELRLRVEAESKRPGLAAAKRGGAPKTGR